MTGPPLVDTASVDETSSPDDSGETSGVGTADVPELRFVAPLLGLEALRRFALVSLGDGAPLFSLTSLEDPEVSVLVLAPAAVFDGYAPELDAVTRAALGLGDGEDPLLLVVVTAAESLETSTANLLAPVVVNPATMAAAQVVLTGSDLPLRAPLGG